MNEKSTIYNNRLKDFMVQYKFTNSTFAQKYNYSESSVRDYKSGKTKLPYEMAFKIAEEYDISVDWLYCRNSFMNKRDTMIEILLALYKIFAAKKVLRKETDGTYEEIEFYINDTFLSYLFAIQRLEFENSRGDFFDNEEYQKARSKVQANYREYLKKIFNLDGFNKEEPDGFDKEVLTKINVNVAFDDIVIPVRRSDTENTDTENTDTKNIE